MKNLYAPRMITGGIVKAEIQSAADRIEVGDKITYTVVRDKRPERHSGVVLSKHPSFVVVGTTAYRECVPWIDLISLSSAL